MRGLKYSSLLLLLCLCSVLLLAEGKKYSLKTEWKKGSKLSVSIDEKLTYAYAGADAEKAQRTLTMELEVLEPAANEVSMRVRITSVKREGLDTKNLPSGPSKKLFSLLKEKGITVTLSSKGEVKKIEGFEELCKEVVPGDSDEDKMSRQMLKLQWEESIKGFMELFGFVTSDGREVTVGDKWTRKRKSTAMITLDCEIEYSVSLKEVKKEGDEKIAVVSYAVASLKSEFLQVKESKGEGTLLFSLTKKRIKKFSLNQEFVVNGDKETHLINVTVSEKE